MQHISAKTTIEEIVASNPASAEVFEKIGIDYCCGGKTFLETACTLRGLSLEFVLSLLNQNHKSPQSAFLSDSIETMSLNQLVNHIESTHHILLRKELERLSALTLKVAKVHGPNDSRLVEVNALFLQFSNDLLDHMDKEEGILFPLICEIEMSPFALSAHCGSVVNPINHLNFEHTQAEKSLKYLRDLTDNFTPPSHACFSYRSMLTGLAAMDLDLREHMDIETRLLFPKVIQLELSRQQSPNPIQLEV
jgi:regulator of cell morphogenesis and NO signaling